jgi:hypothetical protein
MSMMTAPLTASSFFGVFSLRLLVFVVFGLVGLPLTLFNFFFLESSIASDVKSIFPADFFDDDDDDNEAFDLDERLTGVDMMNDIGEEVVDDVFAVLLDETLPGDGAFR